MIKGFTDTDDVGARLWHGAELSWFCKVLFFVPSHHHELGTAGGQAYVGPAWVDTADHSLL